MSTPMLLLLLLYFFLLLTINPSSVIAYLVRPGCNDTCGNVSIPFPFGIGSSCSINNWYLIDCTEINGSFTPRLWINGSNIYVEVLNISLITRTITVKTQEKRSCGNGTEFVGVTNYGLNLSGSPFFFSKEENKFILFGCGISLLQQEDSTLSGCMSTCVEAMRDISSCYGIGCCETRVPYYLNDYSTNFTSEGFKYSVNFSRICISTFLADRDWFPDSSINPFNGSNQSVNVNVVLSWTIGDSDFQAISGCKPQSSSIYLVSGEIRTWTCPCSSSLLEDPQINPYLNGQCIDISGKKNWTAAIIGISTSLGVLLLAAAIFTSYKLLIRRRNQVKREKLFKRNGGILLQNQLHSKDSIIEKTRIFTALELERATDNFNETRILGRGSQGTVYKGMLSDGRIVAIKKSKQVSERQLEQFINEIVILSQVVHKNVVTLLGCCLETEVPLLVYEFIPNGTLYHLIHGDNHDFLTWNMRLKIATEVAAALAYLHTAVSIPVYHRDIKSSNILLDEKYTPKISDFGVSKCIALDNDQTHITTIVKGTFGYLDPEYFQSSQFTEKSDVYSFGVVLAELLTKQKAVSLGPEGEDSRLSLATRFLECMEENCLDAILDPRVLGHSNKEEIVNVAKLAEKCINLNGKKRPTMREVAMELERIRMSNTEADSLSSIAEEAESSFDASDTCPLASSSITSVSDTQPILFDTN